MNVRVIQIPYDSAHRSQRMGRGPEHFVINGIQQRLTRAGHDVELHLIEPDGRFLTEITTAFDLNRKLAALIKQDEGLPVVLAGNCNCSIGVLGGIATQRTALIWFDGHGDFNTPETTVSGFLDGMSLAIATGRCWRALARSVPGFQSLPDEHVILVGARDFDAEEKRTLEESKIRLVTASMIREQGANALSGSLSDLSRSVDQVYVHIDLDVLDPDEAPANQYSPPNGISIQDSEAAVTLIKEKFRVCAVSIGAYDPEFDPNGCGMNAGFKLIELLLS